MQSGAVHGMLSPQALLPGLDSCLYNACRPKWVSGLPSLLRLPLKLLLQAFNLFWLMFVVMPAPKAILLQVNHSLALLSCSVSQTADACLQALQAHRPPHASSV